MNKSTLVFAAHPDDQVRGCARTIATHAAYGDHVQVLIVAEGATSRHQSRDRNQAIDRRFWQENWLAEVGFTNQLIAPPAAIEMRITLTDWGEVERLYVMPAFE